MKRSHLFAAGLFAFAGLTISSVSEAQTLNSKKTRKKSAPSSLYSSLELRHYTDVKMEGDETNQTAASQQVRATLGTRFFSNKLDMNVQVGVNKYAGTPGVATLRRPAGWISYDLFSNSHFSTLPYTYLLFSHTDQYGVTSGTDGYSGISQSAFTKFKTSMGTIGLSGLADLSVGWTDEGKKVIVDGLSPEDAEQSGYEGHEEDGAWVLDEKENDPSYSTRYEVSTKWTPRGMKSFSVQLLAGAVRNFVPYYVYTAASTAQGETELTYPGYTETYNRLKFSYKATKSLSLSNETYQTYDGFFEGSRNSSDRGQGDYRHRLQNILKMTYSM
jgi:hypothetical protein